MAALILGISAVLIFALAYWIAGISGSAIPIGPLIAGMVLAPIFVAVLVALFLIGVHDRTRLTVLISLLGLLATSIAWSYKKLLDSLRLRAQMLIQELLADGPRPRTDIRTHLLASNFLFRLDKSLYVDALAMLLTTKVVRVVADGKYELTGQDLS
jgi:hypothetical protein